MKAQILKIAGVKTEAEFYKKYPTEEAFMKKHGKELKKAQKGASVNGADFFGNTDSNYGYDSNAYIPSPNENSGNSFKSKMQGLGSRIKQGMDDSTKEADLSVPAGLAGMIGGITSGISTINQTKKNVAELQKYGKISDVALQAATSRPERSMRRYARPEDNLVMAANPLGKPSSLLAAQNGAEIANTFAPNTIYTDMGYEPLNDSDKVKAFKKGGKLKKAEIGAMMGMANSAADLSRASGQIGGLLGSQWGGAGGETGGYSQALGGFGLVGGIAGGLLDAPMIKRKQQAQGYLNNNLGLIAMQSGMNSPHMENGGYMNPEYNPQVIAKFGEYSMDQLLAPPHDADMLRAGGHLKEYTPPSARAMYTGRDLPYQMEYGGQMAMGGDLQVHRGEAETLSYNPFLPDGGETVMFRGPSHDDGGMPISFGENGVEVEGGEPAVKLQDGGSPDGNLVVFGNMVIPNYGVAELGDDKAKGKKFKHYVDDLSKIEAKQNKLVDKTTQLIDNVDVNDQFDKLTLNTGQANLIGTSMKLKNIAEKKKTAAAVQNAILDTASEMGVESDALAKGKIKYAKANDPYAKYGAKMKAFQDGGTTEMADRVRFRDIFESEMNKEGVYKSPQQIEAERLQDEQEAAKLAQYRKTFDDFRKEQNRIWGINPTPGIGPVVTSSVPAATAASKPAPRPTVKQFEKQIPFAERKKMALANGIKGFRGLPAQNKKLLDLTYQSASNPMMPAGTGVLANPPAPQFNMFKGIFPGYKSIPVNAPSLGINNIQKAAVNIPSPVTKEFKAPEYEPVKKSTEEKEKGKFPLDMVMMGVNSVLPFVRPSNQMTLDPSQLTGEMYAMSQNQEEPVFAQSYQPMLSQPISISLQDQINEITAQANASKRLAQNNPSLLPMIDAQLKKSIGEVLGEQFRMNQGEAQRVAETNRQTINEAMKTNIGLFDQQQQRQSQARSNTKMQNITALNSISDKIAKNKLENRQLAISENLYNYRFTPNGVAYNINPLAQLNMAGNSQSTDGVAPAGYEFYKSMRKKGTSKKDDTEIGLSLIHI